MTTPVQIVGSNGKIAEVSPTGELAISPIHYNQTEFNELAVINTAYNFYGPAPGKQFVLDSMMVYADKEVNTATNATVIVYEATSSDTTDVEKIIIQFELGQNQSLPFPNLRVLVTEGVWINAKTDDDDIHMTLLGYFINAIA